MSRGDDEGTYERSEASRRLDLTCVWTNRDVEGVGWPEAKGSENERTGEERAS